MLTFRPFCHLALFIKGFIRTQPNDIYTDIERGFRFRTADIHIDQKLQNKNILKNKYLIILSVEDGVEELQRGLFLNTYKITKTF